MKSALKNIIGSAAHARTERASGAARNGIEEHGVLIQIQTMKGHRRMSYRHDYNVQILKLNFVQTANFVLSKEGRSIRRLAQVEGGEKIFFNPAESEKRFGYLLQNC